MEQLKNTFEYSEIKTLAERACVNWHEFAEELKSAPIYNITNDATWFYVTKDNNKKYFNDSTGFRELRPANECLSKNGSRWLCLILWDIGWDKATRIHPLVEDRFGHILKLAKQIPGISVINIHFIGSGVDLTNHTDGDNNDYYSTLVQINSPNTSGPLLSIEDYPYPDAHTTQLFSFNSCKLHWPNNTSSEDWISLVLRIERNQYV